MTGKIVKYIYYSQNCTYLKYVLVISRLLSIAAATGKLQSMQVQYPLGFHQYAESPQYSLVAFIAVSEE